MTTGAIADEPNAMISQPWINQCVSGHRFIFKWYSEHTSYQLLASNVHSMWSETLSEAEIKSRNKELNPSYEAPLKTLLLHLNVIVKNEQKESTKAEVVNITPYSLDLRYHLKIGPTLFSWKFTLLAVPTTMIVHHLTLPLIAMVGEQQRRLEELYRLLHKKDCEIEDYKRSGARMAHKYKETKPFNESDFVNDMNLSDAKITCVEQSEKNLFTPAVQKLYVDVNKCLFQTNKQETGDLESADLKTNDSLRTGDVLSNKKEATATSTTTSHTNFESEIEFERKKRAALEKRIVQKEKDREAKRKKKELKL